MWLARILYIFISILPLRPRYKYIMFKIEKDSVVPAELIEDGDFDAFLGKLPENDGRFCVLDFLYQTNDGRESDKVVFVSWCARAEYARLNHITKPHDQTIKVQTLPRMIDSRMSHMRTTFLLLPGSRTRARCAKR
jgi:hypothetical protein